MSDQTGSSSIVISSKAIEKGQNPFLAEFLHSGVRRDALVAKYGWAVPGEAALSALAALGPIVEMGAGSGYWAWLLRVRGVDVVAYDAHPYRRWVRGTGNYRKFTSVRCGRPEKLRRHADRALFLCWPPYAEPMAHDCLRYYSGDTIAYVGEGAEGCTADDAFHAELCRDWNLEREVQIPRWAGIHDSLFIYRRAAKGQAV